ncbi:MAG: serine/threonine protein kinase [Magnetococcales bacterium]|nr:serine/threonine protein kinase [Magnetococcales bacterium]
MVGRLLPMVRRHEFGSTVLWILFLLVDQTTVMQHLEQGAYEMAIPLYNYLHGAGHAHTRYLLSLPLKWGLYGGLLLILLRLLPSLSHRTAMTTSSLLGGVILLIDALFMAIYAFWLPVVGPLCFLMIGHGLLFVNKKSRPPSPAPAPGATERPRPTLGHYQLERRLGKGAMSTVYLARDQRTDQEVALKIFSQPRPGVADQSAAARQRFLHGATLAARLNHPQIVRILDQGEASERAYIVMERLTGYPLERHTVATQDNPLLPVPCVILLVAQVAMALDYAHKNQVVHRDIKPANIFFDPATNQVKVVDFGIAQAMTPDDTDPAAKTRRVAGTPYYMSPEQLLGKPVDGRSDLFSLGVVFYQLLTGCLPFPAREMETLLIQISREPPEDLLIARPALPACLRTIVSKALQKEASQRYQTGRQLTNDLVLCVKNLIISTRKHRR